MVYVMSFFSGLLFANGIPHFIHGVSGKDFHRPAIRRFLPLVPSPLFNVIWGILNLAAALLLAFLAPGFIIGLNPPFALFSAGFVVAAVGLSIYFPRREKRESSKKQ